jgi:hypothetical protein
MRWMRHAACMLQNAYNILVDKLEENRPPGRPKLRSEDITMDFKEAGVKIRTGFIWLRVRACGRLF